MYVHQSATLSYIADSMYPICFIASVVKCSHVCNVNRNQNLFKIKIALLVICTQGPTEIWLPLLTQPLRKTHLHIQILERCRGLPHWVLRKLLLWVVKCIAQGHNGRQWICYYRLQLTSRQILPVGPGIWTGNPTVFIRMWTMGMVRDEHRQEFFWGDSRGWGKKICRLLHNPNNLPLSYRAPSLYALTVYTRC